METGFVRICLHVPVKLEERKGMMADDVRWTGALWGDQSRTALLMPKQTRREPGNSHTQSHP
jgi:hypothetical protein